MTEGFDPDCDWNLTGHKGPSVLSMTKQEIERERYQIAGWVTKWCEWKGYDLQSVSLLDIVYVLEALETLGWTKNLETKKSPGNG